MTFVSALPDGVVRYRALDGFGRADVRGWLGSLDQPVARVVLEYGDGHVLSVATRSFASDVELATFLLHRPSHERAGPGRRSTWVTGSVRTSSG